MALTMKEFPPFHVGDRLRKAREEAGYDAKAFAEKIGISRDSLRDYERGKTMPRPPVLLAWANATGFSVEQLKGDPEPGPDGGGVADLGSRRKARINGESSSACTRWPSLELVAA